jgi:hypothetical protein
MIKNKEKVEDKLKCLKTAFSKLNDRENDIIQRLERTGQKSQLPSEIKEGSVIKEIELIRQEKSKLAKAYSDLKNNSIISKREYGYGRS